MRNPALQVALSIVAIWVLMSFAPDKRSWVSNRLPGQTHGAIAAVNTTISGIPQFSRIIFLMSASGVIGWGASSKNSERGI